MYTFDGFDTGIELDSSSRPANSFYWRFKSDLNK